VIKLDATQAAIKVREYFEGIAGVCPVMGFQAHSIEPVGGGFDVVCNVCSVITPGDVEYRAFVDRDGKVTSVEKVI